MKFLTQSELLTFDDVTLVPQYSTISSRTEVDLTSGRLKLKLPIISSNMDSVTELEMMRAMEKAGGLGILHRFLSLERLQEIVRQFKDSSSSRLALSVGVRSSDQFLEYCAKEAEIVCLDVAHGHSQHALRTLEKLKKFNNDLIIIAGNVATGQGLTDLADAGASIIKVGVGSGSFCTTRVMTGHGIPQLSAISACAARAQELGVEIIADGGVRNSGDIAKCLAAGANYVMLGGLLAATDEAPGQVFVASDGKRFKQYRGSASLETQVDFGREKETIVPEGVSQFKPARGPVSKILHQLAGGLRSALSYTGASTIPQFQEKALFVKVTHSSFIEGTPHGLNLK